MSNISSIQKAFKNAIVETGLTGTGGVNSVGKTVVASASFARPANTSGYNSNGTIADSTTTPTPMLFAGLAAANNGSGYVTKVQLFTDNKAFLAPTRLHLFNAPPTVMNNDGQGFACLWADRDSYQGYVDMETLNTEDTTSSNAAKSVNKDLRLAFTCSATSKDLYGVLQAKLNATPTSGQNFSVKLTIEQT